MVDFVQNTFDGIFTGSSYALLAIGFTLIFGVMRRINLAYGSVIMVGAFAGLGFSTLSQSNLVAVAVITIFVAVLVGIYVERISFWAIRGSAGLASMVSSFALSMQLEELVILNFPERTYLFPSFDDDIFVLGPFLVRETQFSMFAFAVCLMVFLSWLLNRTQFGLKVCAVSENPLAAKYVGINVGLITFFTFVLASIIGGTAGFLVAASTGQITPMFGLWITFKGLIAMMLGGIGSIYGAVLGGLALGVLETHSIWYLGVEYRDIITYVVLFSVLLLKPGGFFGSKSLQRRELAFRRV